MRGVKYHGPTPPQTGSWTLDPTNPDLDAMVVDGWRIDCDRLYHRHSCDVAMLEIEYDVNERVCWECEATCPDSIWFWHKLQQI
jgi:hypothetical protein